MTDAHTDSTTHLESEHLKAAREWLDGFMARMTAPDAETSQFSNDRSLAALLAEWERKGLERAAAEALKPPPPGRLTCCGWSSGTVEEVSERIRALAQPPSTDKPQAHGYGYEEDTP